MPITWQAKSTESLAAIAAFGHSNAEYGIIKAYEKLSHSANCREPGQSDKEIDVDSIPQTSGIYQILCVPTGKIYIGSSGNVAKRWGVHCKRLRGHCHENSYLQNAWDKYGADAFTFTVLEITPIESLLEREQHWLDALRPYVRDVGFNMSAYAGAPMRGRKHTADTLARMSRKSTGRKHTEKTKRMMSERNKGKRFGTWTAESGRKHAESMRGFKHSPETIERIRSLKLEANAASKAFIVTFPDGHEETITNLAAFCRLHDLSVDCMRNIAHGKGQYQHKGWKCRRA